MTGHRFLPAVMAAVLLLAAPPAHAQDTVPGTPEIVRIELKDVSVEDALGALRDAYGLSWRSNVPLTGRVSGTFDGPLPQVLARLLDGMNYVLTSSGNRFHVAIVSAAGAQPIPGAPAAAPTAALPFPMPATRASPPAQLPPGLVIPPPPPPIDLTKKN
jgi:hypothetical protein